MIDGTYFAVTILLKASKHLLRLVEIKGTMMITTETRVLNLLVYTKLITPHNQINALIR